jgi:hypothetical protein
VRIVSASAGPSRSIRILIANLAGPAGATEYSAAALAW